jgi:hypothetical protein
MEWVAEALRQSHAEERQYRDEAIARLQAEDKRLQNHIDSMYVDKLDGRVDTDFFVVVAGLWLIGLALWIAVKHRQQIFLLVALALWRRVRTTGSGMGEVYLAEHIELRRRVAVSCLH